MNPLDYGRSLIIGTAPGNEVRFVVESRTRIVDEKAGTTEEYFQCASCKSENTFGESDLFIDDNYDFLPVFGTEFGIYFRRRAWLNENYKSILKTEEMWDGLALAFVAFNAPHFADFVIEVPTSARPPGADSANDLQVHHYSEKLTLEAENRLYVSYCSETGA